MSKFKGKNRNGNATSQESLSTLEEKNKLEEMLKFPVSGPSEMCSWLSEVVLQVNARCAELSACLNIPRKMQMKLDAEIQELLCFHKEYSAASRELKRVKFQTSAVHAIKKQIQYKLQKVRSEEDVHCQELAETCLKPVKGKCPNLRSKNNSVQLIKFINEAKDKKKGLELLIELAEMRVNKLGQQVQIKKQKKGKQREIRLRFTDEAVVDGAESDTEDDEEENYGSHSNLQLTLLAPFNTERI